MEKYLFGLANGFVLNPFLIVFWHKMLGKKIDFKDYKIYVAFLILEVVSTIINMWVPQFVKLFVVIIMLFVVNYIFFCRNFTKNIILVLLAEFIVVISEFIFSVICLIFFKDIVAIQQTLFGVLIANICIGIIAFAFLKISCIYKVYNYLLKTFDNMKKSNLIIYFMLTLVLVSVFAIMSYMNLPVTLMLACNTLLTFLYIIMLFRMANARENYKSVNSKYETSLSSLLEYEQIMDRYKIANHENKNELLTIRNMVDPKDKKTINYIDKLIDNKIKDNETIFYKTSKIPDGGLKAIIYSKLCKMDDMKIKYELDIANDVKTIDLIKIGDTTTLNICKVIGVFLDNAIEAVSNLKKKKIILEIFIMDDLLYIDISNNYEGMIEVNKITNKGYTTKGKGHGYGLTLVNEIVKSDDNLERESKVSKELFTQRLIIKM